MLLVASMCVTSIHLLKNFKIIKSKVISLKEFEATLIDHKFEVDMMRLKNLFFV